MVEMMMMINVLVMTIHFVLINKENLVLLELMVEEEMEIKNDFVRHWNKIENYKNYLDENYL
jgi:hypothetical protein